jgi:hypothetical protein
MQMCGCADYLAVLYHGTDETFGTVGTLFTPKTPEKALKKALLQAKLSLF